MVLSKEWPFSLSSSFFSPPGVTPLPRSGRAGVGGGGPARSPRPIALVPCPPPPPCAVTHSSSSPVGRHGPVTSSVSAVHPHPPSSPHPAAAAERERARETMRHGDGRGGDTPAVGSQDRDAAELGASDQEDRKRHRKRLQCVWTAVDK